MADTVFNKSMDIMHGEMQKVRYSGNADADFASLMIPHHQGAIEMSKAELQFGTDPRLRRLAQEIIVTQQSEIEVMKAQLAALRKGRFIWGSILILVLCWIAGSGLNRSSRARW